MGVGAGDATAVGVAGGEFVASASTLDDTGDGVGAADDEHPAIANNSNGSASPHRTVMPVLTVSSSYPIHTAGGGFSDAFPVHCALKHAWAA